MIEELCRAKNYRIILKRKKIQSLGINDFIFIASLLMLVNKEGSGVLQCKFLGLKMNKNSFLKA